MPSAASVPSCLFSAARMSWSSLSRRCAAANACNVGATALHALVTSAVKRVQPTVTAKASRSILSTLKRSRTSWSLISSTERFSMMVSRSSRHRLMSEAVVEALVAVVDALVTAVDRLARASLIFVAEKPIVFINDRPSITGQTIHASTANRR